MALIDIKTWAVAKVNNKTVRQRIWHSGWLHSTRSATTGSGSFSSKALKFGGALGRGALKFVPIPILGTLAVAAESAAENALRGYITGKKLKKAESSGNTADIAKWKIKALSIDGLDRYRKKVEMASNDLLNQIANFTSAKTRAASKNKPCDAYADLALAYAQLERRTEKLKLLGISVTSAGDAAQIYANETQAKLKEAYEGLNEGVSEYIFDQAESSEDAVVAAHHKCSKYCVARQVINSDSKAWNAAKTRFAALARHTTANVAVTDFAAMKLDHKTGEVSFNDQYKDARI